MENYTVTEGALITQDQVLGQASVVVIGPSIADTLLAGMMAWLGKPSV